MTEVLYDVLILGGGPSGLTAAIYTSRASLNTLVVAGQPSGGQLMWTTTVENFPGFPSGILGPELIKNFREQAQKFGATLVDENVIGISGSLQENFTIKTDAGNSYCGKVVIVATGASAKWLGLESELRLRGKGVSACATCDGFFFKDKVVAVVGGGDAAIEEALFLAKVCPTVHVLVRGNKEDMKAGKFMQTRAFANPKIAFHYNTEVLEVLGTESVAGIKVVNNVTKEEAVLEDIRGLFVAIGHKPNTEFLAGFVELGRFGYVNVVEGTKSSKEGVFVAGDVFDYKYRQAVTAAAFGCMAAIDAEKFLAALA